MDSQIAFDTWQIIAGFIVFIITIISATVTICAFIYKMRERIKVLEVKLENQEKELKRQETIIKKFENLFQDFGFNMIVESATGKKTK